MQTIDEHLESFHQKPLTELHSHLEKAHGFDCGGDPACSKESLWTEHQRCHGYAPEEGRNDVIVDGDGNVIREDHSYTIDDLARDFVEQVGAHATETNVEQMKVYLEAFEIFLERNARWEDLWAEYGWMDSLQHIRSKAGRMMRTWWGSNEDKDPHFAESEESLDSVIDLINYCVFFIRNFRNRNKWGRR